MYIFAENALFENSKAKAFTTITS